MWTETIFRALADATRLRILRLLGEMELAVGELAQVLGQSQPRVSRHVAILCDARLAERRKEGSWVFLRAYSARTEARAMADAVARLLAHAERQDAEFGALCEGDRRKLNEIRSAREASAGAYFERHAADWDNLRKLHSSDSKVERALSDALAGQSIGRLLDIGTGTGRMAELFAPQADHIVALDKSLEMLRIARAKLQTLPPDEIDLVQGDFTDLPYPAHSFDTVLLHQVLHFAQDPAAALHEAARVTKPDGRIAIVDFAAHTREELRELYTHTRLGFADPDMAQALEAAGYEPAEPITLGGDQLTVKIWIGRRTPTSLSVPTSKAASS